MNISPHVPSRHPKVWRARIAALIMAAAVGVGGVLQLQSAYHTAIESAETLVAALTKAIAERVHGSVRAVDSLLDETAAGMEAGRSGDPVLAQRILMRLEMFPEVHYVGALSAGGRLQYPTWPRIDLPEGGLDISDQSYFKQLSTPRAAAQLVVGHPVIGRSTGRRSLHLARQYFNSEGVPQGGVVAAVNPDIYARFLETLLVDRDGAAAVIHTDGLMIARAPEHESKFAINIGNSELFTLHAKKRSAGVAHFIAKADGNDKIVGYRILQGYPLLVTCGISRDTALAEWRRLALTEGALAAFFFCMIFYWAWRSDRSASELLAYGRRLETAVEARTRELATARDTANQQARRLEKVNNELHRMAMVTAHHLQEPLRPMVSYSQLLEQRLNGKDSDANDMLTFIRHAAIRLKALLRDFQRYVAALTDQPCAQQVDVGAVVAEAADAARRILGPDTFSLDIGETPQVLADPALLREVFRELFTNAVVHHGRPGPAQLRVRCQPEENGWTFRVADDGPGIPPELHKRVLQVFENAARRDPESTGLGLPLCRLIVEAHGGDITIESGAGSPGTSIRFWLPETQPPLLEPEKT